MAARSVRSIGYLLLGIWLILVGVRQIVSVSFPGLDLIMAVLAIAAGVLILIGR